MFLLDVNPEAIGRLVGTIAILSGIGYIIYILARDKMDKGNKKKDIF